MGDELILYVGEKNISSWSMRAFVALSAKNLKFEERTIPLREDKDRAQRRKVSPTGRVPVLRHGDLVIPDSLAIIEYLEETFPPPAHPASGFTQLRESMSFNLCFLKEPPRPTPGALQEAAEMLSYFQDALEAKRAPGPFLFGPFTAADVMYATAIVRLTAFRVPTAAAPKTPAYMEAVLAHPAVKRWMDAARALPPRETY